MLCQLCAAQETYKKNYAHEQISYPPRLCRIRGLKIKTYSFKYIGE